MGSAHEDEGIELGLAALKDILLNGLEPYFPILALDAELALEVGERVLEAAESKIGFVRRQYPPPLTISLLIKLFQPLLGSLQVAGADFYIAGTRIDVYLRPKSIAFVVVKNGRRWELTAPTPSDPEKGRTLAFCLEYDLRRRLLKTLSPEGRGESVECNLGVLIAQEFCPDQRMQPLTPFAARVAWLVHERQFTEDEVRQLPEVVIEPPTIERQT